MIIKNNVIISTAAEMNKFQKILVTGFSRENLDEAVWEKKGYYNNCGYGEFGITLAPIGGELLPQIILDQTPSIDTTPFLFSRFNNKKIS